MPQVCKIGHTQVEIGRVSRQSEMILLGEFVYGRGVEGPGGVEGRRREEGSSRRL